MSEIEILEYLNKNKQKMLCNENEHYMFIEVQENSGIELSFDLFRQKLKSEKGNPIIDVNAYYNCGLNGEMETVQDYIKRYKERKKHISKIYKKTVKLEKFLKDKFGEKYYHELTEAEK